MSWWAWAGIAVYLLGAVGVFLFAHSFGGVFGDAPLWKELLMAAGWPLFALWFLFHAVRGRL